MMLLLVSLLLSSCGSESSAAGEASAGNEVDRGEYLVTIGGCNDCHSPKVMTAEGPVPDQARLLSGHPADEQVTPMLEGALSPTGWIAACNGHMTAWVGPWGVSYAVNLTPHPVTGTGSWTPEAFIKAMRTGKHLGAGRLILPPMPWQGIGKMTDGDLRAMFAYLQSLKPIDNQVPQPSPPAAAH
jgi:hypothetical protein